MHLAWRDSLLLDLNSRPVPKTKLKVFKAFLDLSKDQNYDSISAKSIYTRSGVAKSTFYQHFGSKDDILHWYWGMITEAGIVQIGRSLTWEEGHYITTSGIEFAFSLIKASAQSKDTLSGFLPYALRDRKEQIRKTLSDYKKIEITEKLKFQISALAGAEQAAMVDYFNEEKRDDIDTFVDYLISIVPRDLYEAMQLTTTEEHLSQANPWGFLLA